VRIARVELRSRDQWERWYASANPWGTEGGDDDLVREAAIIDRMRHAHFANLLDLGCGEGRLTSALATVSDRTIGIDISERALERARSRYPHIEFQQGDLPEALARPEIVNTPFDFICVAEVLYYFQTDAEREAVLTALARIGAPACVYYFSVLLAQSKHRRYFTFDEFIGNVTAHFNVIDVFPSIVSMPPALDIVRRLLPSQARISMLKNWAATRKAENCRHLGCFAIKRDTRQPQALAH
jgi:SAM-dependent methyltransferase